MHLKPDVVVGKKYRILRKLFESSRGVVYLASHVNTERRVTLEVARRDRDPRARPAYPVRSRPDEARAPSSRSRGELRVATVRSGVRSRAAEHVSHRGLVEPIETGVDGADVWVALELMRGETLAQRLESGPLELPELRFVFARLLEIVAALHRAGIVHGHLAPERVFLEENAAGVVRVRLLDFEVVRLDDPPAPAREGAARLDLLGTHSSASTAVVIPRAYRAPEQRSDDAVLDTSSDVFALGAVLFACLSAQRPLDLARLAARTASSTADLPLELAEPALEPYAMIAGYCLAFEPAQRPSSCEDLRRLFEMGGSRPPPLPRQVSTAPAKKSHTRRWLGLGALVLVGVSMALFMRRAEPPASELTAEPAQQPAALALRSSEARASAAPASESDTPTLTSRAEEPRSAMRSLIRPAVEMPSRHAELVARQSDLRLHADEPHTSTLASRHGDLRLPAEPPRASTPASDQPPRLLRRSPSELLFASSEQSEPLQVTPAFVRGGSARFDRARVAARPGRVERTYRLDVEGTAITRTDGGPSPESGASDSHVREALRRSAGQLERCYDAALRASLDAQLRAVGLAARIAIEPSGETSAVVMNGDAPDELIECIRGAVQKWRFPETETSAEFQVPLDFSGAGRVR
jgi:serine/threonine protein kinase